MISSTSPLARAARMACAVGLSSLLGGCAVMTVAGAAVGVVATGVGLAVDATAGAIRLTGKAVGAAGDAVFPDATEE
jgi:hypothetical protein